MKVAYQQLRTSPDSRHDFSAVSLGVRVDETVESCLSLAVSSFIARRCLSRKLQILNSGYVWHKDFKLHLVKMRVVNILYQVSPVLS